MRSADGPHCQLADAVGARQENAEKAATGGAVCHGFDKLLRYIEAPLLQQNRAARARKALEPCA